MPTVGVKNHMHTSVANVSKVKAIESRNYNCSKSTQANGRVEKSLVWMSTNIVADQMTGQRLTIIVNNGAGNVPNPCLPVCVCALCVQSNHKISKHPQLRSG